MPLPYRRWVFGSEVDPEGARGTASTRPDAHVQKAAASAWGLWVPAGPVVWFGPAFLGR